MMLSRRAPTPRHHPQTLVAALTFCLGLFLVRLVLMWWGPRYLSSLHHPWSDPLITLGVVATGATVLYLFLRLDEGDFNALLIVSLILFAGQEALSYFSRTYGVLTFLGLANLVAFSAAIYSSLALTTVVYDGPGVKRDESHRLAIVAAAALFVLSILRAAEVVMAGRYEQYVQWAGLGLLTASAAYLAYGLARSYWRGSHAQADAARPGGTAAGDATPALERSKDDPA